MIRTLKRTKTEAPETDHAVEVMLYSEQSDCNVIVNLYIVKEYFYFLGNVTEINSKMF